MKQSLFDYLSLVESPLSFVSDWLTESATPLLFEMMSLSLIHFGLTKDFEFLMNSAFENWLMFVNHSECQRNFGSESSIMFVKVSGSL